MAMRRTTTIRILRGAMLLVFLTVLIGVGVLWQFARSGQPEAQAAELPPQDVMVEGEEDLLASGVGFSQRVLQGDQELFVIRGCNDRADRDENVFLDGCVEIQVNRPEGGYNLKSERATFSPTTREARLEGDVVVSGPNGLTMETDWLELKNGGNLLVASKGSNFRSDSGLQGRAENFRFDLEKELLVLGGGARVTGSEEKVGAEGKPAEVERYALAARRIVYDRGRLTIRAEGDVSLNYGASEVKSMRMQMWLDEVTEGIKRMRAMWRLQGVLRDPPPEVELAAAETGGAAADSSDVAIAAGVAEPGETREMRFTGQSLQLFNNAIAEEPESFILKGLKVAPAVLVAESVDGTARRSTTAVNIQGTFTNGNLTEVNARGRVHLVEVVKTEEKTSRREVMAQLSRAEIDSAGELVRLHLEEDVYLEDGVLQARSDKALLDVAQDRTVLDGNPVELRSTQGVLNSPSVTVNGTTQMMTASGGVRAVLEEGDDGLFSGSPLGAAEGPIRVQSKEALVRTDGAEFMFRGEVRAWRGKNVLLADQLRGNDAEQSMVATGAPLKTVWYPEATEPESEVTGPVEIASEFLSYSSLNGRMLYESGVRAVQPGRSMACETMDIAVDENGEADQMDCKGSMVMVDEALQRTISGHQAIYHLAEGEVEIFGDPFTLEDRLEETRLQGPSLWYRFEDGAYKRVRNSPEPKSDG